MKKTIYISILFFSISTFLVYAQDKTNVISLNSNDWIVPEGVKTTFETFEEKETILLNGRVLLKNENFSNGILEVDIYSNQKRSFAGIIFRNQEGTREEAYLRMHKSRQPDALQYTPTFNGESSWQLYREHQVSVPLKKTGWNTLKIEVMDNAGSIYVNNEKVLTINNLRTGNVDGQIGLFSLFENRFTNFRVTKSDSIKIDQIDSSTSQDPNIINSWNITQAKLYVAESFDFKNASKEKSILVQTEDSGLLPISKYIKKSISGNFEGNPEAYTIATLEFDANEEKMKLFSFDYSDKIIVYLNQKPIFSGNNAFRAKGVQFKGHLEINSNKLYLNLIEGRNVLQCVVIDRANGWGLMGKID